MLNLPAKVKGELSNSLIMLHCSQLPCTDILNKANSRDRDGTDSRNEGEGNTSKYASGLSKEESEALAKQLAAIDEEFGADI